VRLLFVGESPPSGGTFFYRGDSMLARCTREAFKRVYGEPGNMQQFLKAFRDRGCYLVDLSAEPVDGLEKPSRRRARRAGVAQLAEALRDLRPAQVVAVMKAIEPQVREAVVAADLAARAVTSLPFPAFGHQQEYIEGLATLLSSLELDTNV
jgi:hypothetical protein